MSETPPIRLLSGGHNFRDLGGYANRHGQTVARGKVYRSGLLTHLTDDDHRIMNDLGIRVICDLRTTKERASRPSRLPQAPAFAIWERDHVSSTADLVARMAKPGFGGNDTRQMMIDLYRELAYEQAPSYRAILHKLAEGESPLVFHCSAGKDRTGIVAALLLDLLDVPREAIRADYLATDHAFDRLVEIVMAMPSSRKLKSLPQTTWEPMLRADPAYLDSMFDALTKNHGSTSGFLADELGLDAAAQAEIRRHLLG